MKLLDFIPHSKRNLDILNRIDELSQKIAKISYSLPESNKDAPLVDPKKYFSIPINEFVPTGEGMMSKRIRFLSEVDQYANVPRKIASLFDPSKNTVILTLFSNKAMLGPHYHDFDEDIVILDGKVRIFMDDKIVEPMKVTHVSKFVVHQFLPVTEGVALTIVKEKI